MAQVSLEFHEHRRQLTVFRAVKHIPRWVPGTSFLDLGAVGYKQIENFVTRPFEHVKREMVRYTSNIFLFSDLSIKGCGDRPSVIRIGASREQGDHVDGYRV